MSSLIDLTGQAVGMLTVVAQDRERSGRDAYWIVRCQCGTTKSMRGVTLRRGLSKSCGCWVESEEYRARALAARPRTHSMTHSVEYRTWQSMKSRCTNPNHRNFARYGGRGITVCDEWLNSFEAFYEHMGPRPGPEYSIDRIDNDGGYWPGNCRWATRDVQAANREYVIAARKRGAA